MPSVDELCKFCGETIIFRDYGYGYDPHTPFTAKGVFCRGSPYERHVAIEKTDSRPEIPVGLIHIEAIHIPLAPFDSPTGTYRARCCDRDYCDLCEKGELHEEEEYVPVQREAGSKDDRISADKTYLAKIGGRWFLGKFVAVWYGWTFLGWINPAGYQLNNIEDLYEVDLSPLR